MTARAASKKTATRKRATPEPPPKETLPALAPDPRADTSKDVAVAVGETGSLVMTNLDQMYRFAQYVERSAMCPEGMKAADIVVAIQTGSELGFSPIRSLVACPVVKGKASIAGEAVLALIRRSGLLDPRGDCEVGVRGEGQAAIGWCQAWRKGWNEPRETTFSFAQAEEAGLTKASRTGAKSMYLKYGEDMLIWRAVSRMGKRNFSDVTLGLEIAEVSRTLPEPERDVTPPAGAVGGSTPDPLLAPAFASGEALTPEVLPGQDGPEPGQLPVGASEEADLTPTQEAEAYPAAPEMVSMEGLKGEGRERQEWDPAAVETLAITIGDGHHYTGGLPSVCGIPDRETDDVRCMLEHDHAGPCDWDIDVESMEGALPLG